MLDARYFILDIRCCGLAIFYSLKYSLKENVSLIFHPGGVREGSLGLRFATPGDVPQIDEHPEGMRERLTLSHPFRMRQIGVVPWVALRSTQGYPLSPLRGEDRIIIFLRAIASFLITYPMNLYPIPWTVIRYRGLLGVVSILWRNFAICVSTVRVSGKLS